MKKFHVKIIILIWFLTCITLAYYAYGFQITEIMFNPEGADAGREWIEITLNESDGCINFTEYKFFEEGTNHNIYKYNYENDSDNSDMSCKYIILCNDINKFLQDYPFLNNTNSSNNNNIRLYKSSFSLSNDGENIALKKDNNIIDEMNYTLLIENIDVTEGYSLEYYSNYWRHSELVKGNPGNVIAYLYDFNSTEDVNMTTNSTITKNNNTNNTINEVEINTTIINITINNTVTNNNITINSSENTNENYTQNVSNVSNIYVDHDNKKCNVSINILIKNNSIVYENNVPIKFQNKIETENSTKIESGYVISYWIEDLFGNIVKNEVTTNNQDDKTFTPKIDEADKILVIKNILKNYSCNISNNYSEKIFLVKNSEYAQVKQSTCPVCSGKSSSTESSKCSSSSSSSILSTTQSILQNDSLKPLIKIINVCNDSKTYSSKYDNTATQTNLTQSSYGLKQIQTSSTSSNNLSSKNITLNAGKATGMIVYESPNIKNRLYALIGFILVVITCISIVSYKIIMNKTSGTAIESKR